VWNSGDIPKLMTLAILQYFRFWCSFIICEKLRHKNFPILFCG
jgi:hypothetical protein